MEHIEADTRGVTDTYEGARPSSFTLPLSN